MGRGHASEKPGKNKKMVQLFVIPKVVQLGTVVLKELKLASGRCL
jgi:hypothetical protein